MVASPPAWLLNLLALLEPLDQYIQEIKKLAALESLTINEKMARIRAVGRALSREMEGSYEGFARQLEQRIRELETILNPPKPDFGEQLQRLLIEMSRVVEKIGLRERMTKRWETELPEDIVRAYEESFAAGEPVVVEIFEVYAEDILERKANEAALETFRERRERARESRLTPGQLKAKHELMELERFGNSMRVIHSVLASVLKGEGGTAEPAPPAG